MTHLITNRHRAALDRLWGDRLPIRLTTLAVAGGVAGLAGGIGLLPSALLLIVIGLFVLVGPGSLVMTWYPDLPGEVVCALVPVVGLAIGMLVVSGLLLAGVYAPLPILIAMAALTLSGGLLRRRHLRTEVSTP